jgi:hypothetical protein
MCNPFPLEHSEEGRWLVVQLVHSSYGRRRDGFADKIIPHSFASL